MITASAERLFLLHSASKLRLEFPEAGSSPNNCQLEIRPFSVRSSGVSRTANPGQLNLYRWVEFMTENDTSDLALKPKPKRIQETSFIPER